MTDVLTSRQPSQLLQRRLHSTDNASLMNTFSMAFRPEAPAATPDPVSMQSTHQPQERPIKIIPRYHSVAPREVYDPHPHANPQSLGPAPVHPFSNPYNMANNFNATFGTLAWPNPHMPHTTLVAQPVLPRNESYSSSDSSDTYIKSENQSPVQPAQIFFYPNGCASSPDSQTTPDSADESKPVVFSTDIDVLMRAIQSKSQATPQHPGEPPPPVESQASLPPASPTTTAKKRYLCDLPDCGKAFYQKTHLEIHMRAHTGAKPFLCKEPSCGQRFSQLGNLKTHERRHTGERPYHCDICGKTFAQHGNVRAHKIVHSAAKPFTCRLDNCNKQFTQLGNLKSHQNKFHVDTIRRLKLRFECIKEGDVVENWEKEMWEYFGNLYRNCNKGIKGRGKDRRIGASGGHSSSSSSSSRGESSGGTSSSASTTALDPLQRRESTQSAASATSDTLMSTTTSSTSLHQQPPHQPPSQHPHPHQHHHLPLQYQHPTQIHSQPPMQLGAPPPPPSLHQQQQQPEQQSRLPQHSQMY